MTNSGVDHVTRFPASDPSKVENFKVGYNSSGLAIDSEGNVWVTDRFGNGLLGMWHLIDMGIRLPSSRIMTRSSRPFHSRTSSAPAFSATPCRVCGARLSKGTPTPSSFSDRRFRRIDLSRSPKAFDWS